MEHMNLARKYRPQKFDDYVGQELAVRAVRNSLKNQTLHSSLLFTGTRGVGKTTMARLIAKCLNCEKGVSDTPCNTCSSCRAITEGRHVDVHEVDAASRTKVEETKDLLSQAQYAPNGGRYRIFIIDEVHMLSQSSFNALLKTLEEPPSHVKFLLATTDPQKIPVTVISRCIQLPLSAMSMSIIQDRMSYILTQERVSFDKEALEPIAQAANGSMRDALTMLDHAVALGDGNVSMSVVSAMLGLDKEDMIMRWVDTIHTSDTALQQLDSMRMRAWDNEYTAQLILRRAQHNLLQSVGNQHDFELWDKAVQNAVWMIEHWNAFPAGYVALQYWAAHCIDHKQMHSDLEVEKDVAMVEFQAVAEEQVNVAASEQSHSHGVDDQEVLAQDEASETEDAHDVESPKSTSEVQTSLF